MLSTLSAPESRRLRQIFHLPEAWLKSETGMLKAFQRLQRAHCALSKFRLSAQSTGMLKPLNSTNTLDANRAGNSRFFQAQKPSTQRSRYCALFVMQAQAEAHLRA
jgi:hypothetical protein